MNSQLPRIFGVVSVVVLATALGGWRSGTAPLAAPAQEPVLIEVTETIVVSDGLGVLPAAIVNITENIVVADASKTLTATSVPVEEAISVTDLVTVVTPVVVAVDEHITVADHVIAVTPVSVLVDERIVVLDEVLALPPTLVGVEEHISVSDVAGLLEPAVVSVDESVSVTDVTPDFEVTSDVEVQSTQPRMVGGAPAIYTIGVGRVFAGRQVALRCDDLPPFTSCSFNPPQLNPGPEGATSVLTVSARARSTASMPFGSPDSLAGLLALGLILAAVALSARRARSARLVLPMVLLGLGILLYSACGGEGGVAPTPIGPDPGTYDFVVTATSGSIVRSQTVTLIVQ